MLDLSPQAARLGLKFPVFCTSEVWDDAISTSRLHRDDLDGRIYGLVESVLTAMGKAEINDRDEAEIIEFRHWRVPNLPNKKKARAVQLAARLLLSAEPKPEINVFPVYILIYMPE